MVDLVQLDKKSKTWQVLAEQWKYACDLMDEDFTQFAMSTWPVLEESAGRNSRHEGVFGLRLDDQFHVVCCANSVNLPGYQGRVLRIRHILMSPFYDLGDATIDDYSSALSKLFAGTVKLSNDVMPSPHIKFHLRSVADRQFFSYVENGFDGSDMFSSFTVRGSWLYITKA